MAEKLSSRLAYAYQALARYKKTDELRPLKLFEADSYYLSAASVFGYLGTYRLDGFLLLSTGKVAMTDVDIDSPRRQTVRYPAEH